MAAHRSVTAPEGLSSELYRRSRGVAHGRRHAVSGRHMVAPSLCNGRLRTPADACVNSATSTDVFLNEVAPKAQPRENARPPGRRARAIFTFRRRDSGADSGRAIGVDEHHALHPLAPRSHQHQRRYGPPGPPPGVIGTRHLIPRHQGRITINVGTGSRFTIAGCLTRSVRS